MAFEILNKIQEDSIRKEKMFENIASFNKMLNNNTDFIMHVNIRSMSANFDKLKILIESLNSKPSIVICTETFMQVNYNIYELEGYNSYYNENLISHNGVVVFVDGNIEHESKIIECGRIKLINILIQLSNNSNMEISAVYRSHDIPRSELICYLNKFCK